MKKVIIALDYDPTAQKVAEAGLSLAKAMKAEAVLVHVLSTPTYYSSRLYSPIMGFNGYMDEDTFQPEIVDGLTKASQDFLDKSKNHLGDHDIKTIVKQGDVAESILEVAKNVQADIIIMGSHSQKWLEKVLLGSVTEKVLQHSLIPLFIIPTKKYD